MALLVTSDTTLQKIASPALPLAENDYSRQYQDQLNSVLRLYFIRLQGILGQLKTDSGVIPATTLYAVASLPSAVTSGAGARGFVSDALAPVFGSAVVTGGARVVPVYSDGTNWIVG